MNAKNFLGGFREGFAEFGENIAMLVNSALLLVVYIAGVGLTSLFARAVGKKFLDEGFREKGTYWQELGLKKKPRDDYYRQY